MVQSQEFDVQASCDGDVWLDVRSSNQLKGGLTYRLLIKYTMPVPRGKGHHAQLSKIRARCVRVTPTP